MHCSFRAVKPTVAAPAKAQRCLTKVQAVHHDAPAARKADSLASIAANGALSALVAATLLTSNVANAADLALGQQVFDNNCAACHAGGNNNVIPDHTLRKAAIEQFLEGGYNLEAIVYQIENGKGAMPAWDESLDEDEIQAVAAYVYNQADKWE